jgi:hypothetical protein
MPSLRSSPSLPPRSACYSPSGWYRQTRPVALTDPAGRGSAWGFWPVSRFCLHLTIAEIASDFP